MKSKIVEYTLLRSSNTVGYAVIGCVSHRFGVQETFVNDKEIDIRLGFVI